MPTQLPVLLSVCSVFSSLQRFMWGQSPPAQSSDLTSDPLRCRSFLVCCQWLLQPWTSKQNRRPLACHVFQTTAVTSLSCHVAASGCSVTSLSCSAFELALPGDWVLAARQQGIKSREGNCGSGRMWSAWALESPLLLLKTDEKLS